MNNYLQRLGRSTLSSFKNELYSLGGLIVSVAEDPSIIPSVVSQIGEFTAQNFQELYDYGEGFVNNSGPVAKATANRIKELIVNPEEGGKVAGGLILTTLTKRVTGAVPWNRISGIVRDAVKGKGNFTLGLGTFDEAMAAGKAWVGDGYRLSSNGEAWVSSDGLKIFRPPSFKERIDKTQANFEWKLEIDGKLEVMGNGHLDIY